MIDLKSPIWKVAGLCLTLLHSAVLLRWVRAHTWNKYHEEVQFQRTLSVQRAEKLLLDAMCDLKHGLKEGTGLRQRVEESS